MKIGIRLHDTIPGTLEERLRFVRGQGYECAHLALSKTIPGFSMDDAPVRLARQDFADEVRGAFSATAMDCAVLGCYLNLTHPSEEERNRVREIYFAHLAFAGKTGAWMVGSETPAHPASPLAPDAPASEEAFLFFLDQLRPVVRRAEEENVIMAIEPVYTHIISTPERAERLLTELGSNPSPEEIAEAMHTDLNSAAVYAEMLTAAKSRKQAEAAQEEPESTPEDDQAVENTALFQFRQRVAELLSTLTEQEKKLLALRYGLDGGQPKSPQQVGELLGITARQVVNMETAVMRKLRQLEQ